MRLRFVVLPAALIATWFAVSGFGAPPLPAAKVSYQKQIRPLFERACLSCHSGPTPVSGYSMASRDLLVKGGRKGAAVVVGKGGESLLVKYLTGEVPPRMPSGAAAWDKETIAIVRRWVDEGAAYDPEPSTAVKAVGAKLPAKAGIAAKATSTKTVTTLAKAVAKTVVAPVTALAYSPDGTRLAVGGYRCVRLLDSATGAVVQTIGGASDQVQAIAWSADGQRLAMGGGRPAQSGEIVVCDVRTGKTLRTFGTNEHGDAVVSLAWRPGTPELLSGSLDKTARVWNTDTGKSLRLLKDHADVILAVACSPDGKLMATGSADRNTKIYDANTGVVLRSLGGPDEAVTCVAFSANSQILAVGSSDRSLRAWKIDLANAMENPDRRHEDEKGFSACAFSADGTYFTWGTTQGRVKLFSGDTRDYKREMRDITDLVYSIAVSPKGEMVAAGTQDGTLLCWNTKEGKILHTVRLTPSTIQPTTAPTPAKPSPPAPTKTAKGTVGQ